MQRAICSISCLIIFTVLALNPAPSHASWIQYGSPVSAMANTQRNPKAIPDGAGGVFVAWEDDRNGGAAATDIYAQHVDADGNALWTSGGVAVCTAADIQIDVQLISDGAGGIIVAWDDARLGITNADIYAQRLNASGTPLWTANGRIICGAANNQYNVHLVPDGNGGAILAWEDQRSDFLGDIYAQRINASGTTLWAVNGVSVCNDVSQQSAIDVSSDGFGGILVTWYDFRYPDADVFVNRLDGNGTVLWLTNGRDITSIVGTGELYPRIVGDGAGGATVVWQDARNDDSDLYAVRVNSSGFTTGSHFPVVAATDRQDDAAIIRDPATGDVVVAWVDRRSTASSDLDIYAQRFDSTGKMKWAYNGIPVCTSANNQFEPSLALDTDGGTVMAWEDFRASPSGGMYSQRISAGGVVSWTNNGVALSRISSTRDPAVVASPDGGAFVLWADFYTGDGDLMIQRVEPTHGYWGHPEPVISSVADIPGDQGGFVRVEWLPSDHDAPGMSTIPHYSVWRATSALPKSKSGEALRLVTLDQVGVDFEGPAYRVSKAGDFFWEYMGQQLAHAFPGYSMAVATEADMTTNEPALHYFQVVTHTYSQFVVFPSDEASGTSVDNLAPAAPKTLAATRAGGTAVDLNWSPSGEGEPDFLEYEVYRGSSPSVVIDPGNFVLATPDTIGIDGDASLGSSWYYVVLSKDVHGNLSDASNEAMVDVVTGVGDFRTTTLSLSPNWPNPFGSGGTLLQMRMPTAGTAVLEVFDVRGRRVREIRRQFSEGEHQLRFDGRDAQGAELTSGVYMVRLKYGGESVSRKMILQR